MTREHFNPDFEPDEDSWTPVPTWFYWVLVFSSVFGLYGVGVLFGAIWTFL